jgi:DNA-binding NtrC family response regulator
VPATAVLTKPVKMDEAVAIARRMAERRNLQQRTGISGQSSAIQEVLVKLEQMAPVSSTVLIQGESGTGKELIADLIHRHTPGRGEQAFVEINCASVPETLLESELFGYERGAFTDAKAQKRGLFEQADGGTLFLDEVGDMSIATQAKLLKVLEEMTFRRLGGTRDLAVSVRVVAATNKDLADEVARGRFRLDLYHRLDVFHIHVPPLREHREDILPLANHFLAKLATRLRKPAVCFAPETERLLVGYDYPGNVRELRNVVERAVILSSAEIIDPTCIVTSGPTRAVAAAAAAAAAAAVPAPAAPFFTIELDDNGRPPDLDRIERDYIARLLQFTGGNRTQVARLLGVSYPTVAKKIAEYGL